MHPVTKRRIADGNRADGVDVSGDLTKLSVGDLESQINTISDGIRALQSTDDMGREENLRIYNQEQRLWKSYELLKAERERRKVAGV